MSRYPGVLLVLAVAATGFACSDRMRLDAERVDLTLDRVDASVPLCAAIEAGAPSSARSLAASLGALQEAVRAPTFRGPGGSRTSSGSCGGSLDVTYDHANGITDYVASFAAYCLESDDGPVTLDGVVLAREEGHPTDSGPMIEAFEARTDGELVISQNAEKMVLELGRIRTEYGNPNTWAPDPPDADHPDRTEVDRADLSFPDYDGRKDFARNLRTERTSGWPMTIHIVTGEVGTRGEGVVDIRTPEDDPLVIQIGLPIFEGGSVVLTGARGSEVVVRPAATAEGVFDVELEGVPFSRSVDCGMARGPLLEGALALMTELPLH